MIILLAALFSCFPQYNPSKMKGLQLTPITEETSNFKISLFLLSKSEILNYFGYTKGTSPYIYPNDLISEKKYFNVFVIDFDKQEYKDNKIKIIDIIFKSEIKGIYYPMLSLISFWQKNAPDDETFETMLLPRIEQSYLPDDEFTISKKNRFIFCILSNKDFNDITSFMVMIKAEINNNPVTLAFEKK
jgi:hypothetical protein